MTPQEIRARVGQNILYLRRQYGLSRRALARLYDFHLKRIARIFDISVDLLLAQDPVP